MPGTLIIGTSTIEFRSSRSLHKLGLGRIARKLNKKRRGWSGSPSASGSEDEEDGRHGLGDEYGFILRVKDVVGVRKQRHYRLDGLEITTLDQKVRWLF
jgi:hypothetical protein